MVVLCGCEGGHFGNCVFGLANCRRDVVNEINVLFLNESYQKSLDIMGKLALSLVSGLWDIRRKLVYH